MVVTDIPKGVVATVAARASESTISHWTITVLGQRSNKSNAHTQMHSNGFGLCVRVSAPRKNMPCSCCSRSSDASSLAHMMTPHCERPYS